jgi:hypothetical protein
MLFRNTVSKSEKQISIFQKSLTDIENKIQLDFVLTQPVEATSEIEDIRLDWC